MQTMPKIFPTIDTDKHVTTSFIVGRHSNSLFPAVAALHVKNAPQNSVPAPQNHSDSIQQQALRGGAVSSLAAAPINTKMALAKLT